MDEGYVFQNALLILRSSVIVPVTPVGRGVAIQVIWIAIQEQRFFHTDVC